jgi:hypothetical protein
MKMVVPLDIALGLSQLPFKISVAMMLDIAKRSVNAHSYEELQRSYKEDWNIEISDDQLRLVTNYIGKLVYDDDCLRKDNALDHFKRRKNSGKRKSGVLYIEMDGAMLNTRKSENGSTWKENKLGLVFSSKNIRNFKSESGQEYHKILSREYISYIGNADTFKEL